MTSATIFELIIRIAKEIIPGLDQSIVIHNDSLESIGANSMDRGEIIMTVLEELNLSIPLVETFGPHNIGELADLLNEKLQKV